MSFKIKSMFFLACACFLGIVKGCAHGLTNGELQVYAKLLIEYDEVVLRIENIEHRSVNCFTRPDPALLAEMKRVKELQGDDWYLNKESVIGGPVGCCGVRDMSKEQREKNDAVYAYMRRYYPVALMKSDCFEMINKALLNAWQALVGAGNTSDKYE